MTVYMGVGGVVKTAPELRMGIGGVVKSVNEGHIGINGVNKPFLGYKLDDVLQIVYKASALTLQHVSNEKDSSNEYIINHVKTITLANQTPTSLVNAINAAYSAIGITDVVFCINVDNNFIAKSANCPEDYVNDFANQRGIQIVTGTPAKRPRMELMGDVFILTTSGKEIRAKQFFTPAYSNCTVTSGSILSHGTTYHGGSYYAYNYARVFSIAKAGAEVRNATLAFNNSNIVSTNYSYDWGMDVGILNGGHTLTQLTMTDDNIWTITDGQTTMEFLKNHGRFVFEV